MFEPSDEPNVQPTERVVSMTAGALLALAGLHRSTSAAALTLLGCALALRGATGHCALYRILGVPRSDRRTSRAHLDSCVDTALDDSFPASDPPAFVGGRE
jgi:uncharacterized membrane protein